LAIDFFADRLGVDHHLTSLVRYGFVAGSGRADLPIRLAAPVASLHRNDSDGWYRLAPQLCLLTELHDCPRLLERIRRLPPGAGPLEPADIGSLGRYMAMVNAEEAILYCIDPGVDAILEFFRTPLKLVDAINVLHQVAPEANIDGGLFAELIDIGALVPCPEGKHSQPDVNL
jgi:hypothetical protein